MNTDEIATPIIRGCGTRKKGGIYLETGLSPWGKPVTHFLCDPPIPLADARDIAAIGSQLQERHGVWHVLDWIGQQHYPNVADYIEEVKEFGVSRRIAETIDFSKLSIDSRLLVIHARAQIDNFEDYREWTCPKHDDSHRPSIYPEPLQDKPMCAGIWWEDIAEGSPIARNQTIPNDRRVIRQMPSFSYFARRTPDGLQPLYRPAIFAAFPISRIVLVKGGDRHAEKLAAIQRAQMPIAETDT